MFSFRIRKFCGSASSLGHFFFFFSGNEMM